MLVSCKKTSKVDDTVLAKVDQDYLYLSDLKLILPEQLKGKDSVNFVESYVQKWVSSKLMYRKASENLAENQEEIEEKTEKFRQSLYVYKYEQMLVSQKLNKVISDNDVDDYYLKHSSELLLNENIVKPLFVQVSRKVQNVSEIINLMYSKRPEDLEKIKDFCFQNSAKFFFGEDWMSEKEISCLLPSKNRDLKQLYFSHQVSREQDSENFYLVRIDNVLVKGEIAPKSYVQNEIKQIILQERTQELLKNVRNKIYEDALKNNIFEIYKK